MVDKHSCHWRRTATKHAEHLREQQAELDATKEEYGRLAAKMAQLEHQLALATKQVIGPKSERMPTPDEELRKRQEAKSQRGGYTNPAQRKKNAQTETALPSTVVTHLVPDEQRRCPHCGKDATPIGEGDVTVEYEWLPGRFEKRLHVVEAARCACKQHYVRGTAPARVQEGCIYGPGFIAKLAVDKCADSTPIYRVEKAMQREGIPMARSTMNDLVHLAALVCTPLWNAALEEVRIDPHVQADETSFRIQTRPERSFVWTFLSQFHTVYVYSPSRSGDTPSPEKSSAHPATPASVAALP
jgi:transposase